MRHVTHLHPMLTAALAMALPLGSLQAQFVDVAAGDTHSLALRADGTVIAWGNEPAGTAAVPALPAGLTYVEIAAGGTADDWFFDSSHGFSLARRSDGAVVAWGDNTYGQLDVPPLPPGLTYVEIAAGSVHALARRSDGSVVAWGGNDSGQCNVPALPAGTTYVEIAAGGWGDYIEDSTFIFGTLTVWQRGHSVARRSDDALVVWGDNSHGQKNVPALPPGTALVEIDAGTDHTVGRLSDGSLIAWGDDTFGQCDVTQPPPGLTYESVRAGAGHTLARLSDGSLVSWGNAPVAGAAPPLPAGMSWVAADVGGVTSHWTYILDLLPPSYGQATYSHSLGLRSDGCLLGWGDNSYGQTFQPPGPGNPWTDLGGGTGSPYSPPTLYGSGCELAGSPISVTLVNAPPNAPMVAWIALAPTPFAALGGTVHAYPFTTQLLLFADGWGGFTAASTWPAGLPPGTSIWFQFLMQDPGSIHGISLSNGLLAVTP